MAYVVALLLMGFVLGWFVEKMDFEVVLDLFTVLRECIRNSRHHAELPVQVVSEPLESSVGSATAR